jgi:leucine dehydrogenase
MEHFFRDGLRLSKGMTHKNALAGIWWGGGKGVIARNSGVGLAHTDSAESRQVVYEEVSFLLLRTLSKHCLWIYMDITMFG